jgi:hypothetical protein
MMRDSLTDWRRRHSCATIPDTTAPPPNLSARGRHTLWAAVGKALAAVVAGLLLSSCATSLPSKATAATVDHAAKPAGPAQRDLTSQEKKIIEDAVAFSLRDPASAKYHWAKFPTSPTDSSVNYCAWVSAKSPYPAYDGRQDYIVEITLTGDRVSAAAMGLIAGGKDAQIVRKMCAKYGLDPNNAS